MNEEIRNQESVEQLIQTASQDLELLEKQKNQELSDLELEAVAGGKPRGGGNYYQRDANAYGRDGYN